ncbi:MAG: hypothetical protein HY042_03855, partial [Spirochaetia bacterium]|nr:hypothetical protein [Spirochaetia bacterium]
MKRYLKYGLLAAVGLGAIGFVPGTVSAQEVYTTFKDRAKIEVFTRVSSRLVCQCGCHMVLST